MSKARVKFLIFVGGVAGLLLFAAVGFYLLTNFIASFQQGADPASIFNGVALILPERAEARWLPDANDLPRRPSDAQREELLAAYWAAWRALARARETGDLSDLATYWAGPAYDQIVLDSDTRWQPADARHRLRLTFFSDDQTVAALEDRDFVLTLRQGEDTITVMASADVILTLDNGYWRIRWLTLRYEGPA